MTIGRTRRYLACLLAAAVIAACGTKEQAPPPVKTQEAPPSAAPTTTTTTTTTIPSPPPVWKGAHWGMTKAEVLAAFPGEAQQLATPAEFGAQAPGSTDVAIPSYEMGGMKFRVLFGFEGDALNRVHLSAISAGAATCGDLEKLLTDEHAAPADRSTTRTNLRNELIVWKRPEQTITLACAEAAGLGYRSVTLDHAPPKI